MLSFFVAWSQTCQVCWKEHTICICPCVSTKAHRWSDVHILVTSFLSQNVTAFPMHIFYWFLISPTLKLSFCFPFMLEIFLILINWNSLLSYIKANFKITFQKLVLASLMTTFIDVRAPVERKWKWTNPHRRTLGWTKRRAKGIVYLQGDFIVGGCQFHLSRQTLSLV